jgi:2',3'-cyclic-nucleotide 2'-phosphodiesterase (5'-nucleotidase family)
MMSWHSKIELSIWQFIFIVSLSIICVLAAVFGWFRTIDPAVYKNPHQVNNITSILHPRRRLSAFLDDIGSPPQLHNPHSYVQWTFLQMNDVYELIPLSGGKKGGLARVATIRQLLREENPNTITVLSGDVVSPSALGMYFVWYFLSVPTCSNVDM